MIAQGSFRGSSSCALDRGPTNCNEVEGGDHLWLAWPITADFNRLLQIGGSHERVAIQERLWKPGMPSFGPQSGCL